MKSTRWPPWRIWALVIGGVWVVVFGYLLFAADPPDFFWDDIAEVDGPAHVVGGITTGVIAFVLVADRRRALWLAFGGSVAVLVLLEVAQDVFTDRRYEASDLGLALVGAAAG
ncbi:MAG: hypothetical protein KJO17_01070, partial [Acidimicrobiia bacterium]|nr:hypothetical protein [Acidimicrobiia bacterium]